MITQSNIINALILFKLLFFINRSNKKAFKSNKPPKLLTRIVDFKPPYKCISLIEELEKELKVKFPTDSNSEEFTNCLYDIFIKENIVLPKIKTNTKLLDLVRQYIIYYSLNI